MREENKQIQGRRPPPGKEVLAVIPARGGSKGIPGKNIAEVGGRPLVAYSIMAALDCPLITRVVVSTDCERIAGVAREWGAEVPFLRPKDIADDSAVINDMMDHVLGELDSREQYVPLCVVCLFPTHPFRSRDLMRDLTGKLLDGYGRVRTVRKIQVSPLTYMTRRNGGVASLHGGRGAVAAYRYYGLFTGFWHKWIGAPRRLYTHLLQLPTELVDIDTPEDLRRADEILTNREFVPEWA